MPYPQVHVMRYMGNKSRLLDFIVPRLEAMTGSGDTVLDLMGGTCSVAYALKERNRMLVNDVHVYAYTVAKALIENPGSQISRKTAQAELEEHMRQNEEENHCAFFQAHYADTYFSKQQCCQIDNIRYAAGQADDCYKRALYLTALMSAMCYAQSTTGHFAQYLPSSHPRLCTLRQIDIKEAFLKRCDCYRVIPSAWENRAFNMEAGECLSQMKKERVALVYLDPPYSAAQYSRFYHLLETAVLYDSPSLSHKGLYRQDRFLSSFCYSGRVREAFSELVSLIHELGAKLAISYSDRGLLPLGDLVAICRSRYKFVEVARCPHPHSTQGKGTSPVQEVLITCR